MESPRTVEAENARAVSAHHPLRADRDHGGNPVVLQVRSCGGVVRRDVAFVQERQAAQGARHQFVAGNAERVHVIVDQTMKRIHAARTAGVEEGQARGSSERETTTVGDDIGHVVGNQPIGARQHLLLAAGVVEANQAVRGGDVDRAGFRVGKNSIDAKHVLVFDMPGAAVVGSQQIEAAIEVANPQASGGVRGQRGNVAVGQHRGARFEHPLPPEGVSAHAIEAIPGDGKHGVSRSEQLPHLRQLHARRQVWIRQVWIRAAAFQRNHDHALIFRPNIELRGRGQQRGGQNSRSQHAGEAAAAENGDSGSRADISGVTGNCQRQHLRIGQPLRLGEAVGLARVKVQHAAIQCRHP